MGYGPAKRGLADDHIRPPATDTWLRAKEAAAYPPSHQAVVIRVIARSVPLARTPTPAARLDVTQVLDLTGERENTAVTNSRWTRAAPI